MNSFKVLKFNKHKTLKTINEFNKIKNMAQNELANEVVQEFLQTIPNLVAPQKHTNFVVIAFIGLPGVGKTTTANFLTDILKWPVFSHDQAREFLLKKGLSLEHRDWIEKLNYAREVHSIKNEISHIIDGDILVYYQNLKLLIESYGGKMLLINLVCPENIIEDRLRKRLAMPQTEFQLGQSRADWEFYLKRKKLHLHADYPQEFFFTVETSRDLEPQIKRLLFKMRRRRIIG